MLKNFEEVVGWDLKNVMCEDIYREGFGSIVGNCEGKKGFFLVFYDLANAGFMDGRHHQWTFYKTS